MFSIPENIFDLFRFFLSISIFLFKVFKYGAKFVTRRKELRVKAQEETEQDHKKSTSRVSLRRPSAVKCCSTYWSCPLAGWSLDPRDPLDQSQLRPRWVQRRARIPILSRVRKPARSMAPLSDTWATLENHLRPGQIIHVSFSFFSFWTKQNALRAYC